MIRKLSVIFTAGQKVKFLILFVLLFAGSVLEFLGVSLVLPFVQMVMEPEGEGVVLSILWSRWFPGWSGRERLFLTGLLLAAVYILKNGYLLLLKAAELRFIFNNRLRLAGRLMRSYMEKPYSFHLETNSSEVLESVIFEVNKLYDLLLYVMELVSDLLIIAMIVAFLLWKDPLITLVVTVLLSLCSLLTFWFLRGRTQAYGRENQIYNGRMIQAVRQAMGGIKEIKLTAREGYFVRAYEENGRRYVSSLKKSQFFQYLPKYLLETVCVCGILGVVLARLLLGAQMSSLVPQLSVFAVAAFRLLPSVNQVNRLFHGILFLSPSVNRIYEDIENAGPGRSGRISGEISGELRPADRICLRDVSFGYPGSGEDILSHVNAEIPLGSSVGFVGSSGAGKTTLIDLLLGLLSPDSGGIYYGDQDIRDYRESWGRRLGYIPQTIYLTDDSIRRNIAFGVPDSQIEEEKVWEALEKVQLSDFVRSLKGGLDARIGEAGVRLSGGQRQRLGIARALYREPEILVMDEATSALDTETEEAVMRAVEHLRGRCTLLMIAHRTGTLKGCDRVYRVENHGLLEIMPRS